MVMAVLAKELAGMQALVNILLSSGVPEVLEAALLVRVSIAVLEHHD